ncbi:hypothetical protein Ciccas_001139 [Cichlidogyrus casuarinus]|uniref:Fibronectin type-III domain-containing protein n=1 Tax=Cichlidogyrus casuarinus TaxID=1844966 RepID=A0ABD2QN66_9PLAT
MRHLKFSPLRSASRVKFRGLRNAAQPLLSVESTIAEIPLDPNFQYHLTMSASTCRGEGARSRPVFVNPRKPQQPFVYEHKDPEWSSRIPLWAYAIMTGLVLVWIVITLVLCLAYSKKCFSLKFRERWIAGKKVPIQKYPTLPPKSFATPSTDRIHLHSLDTTGIYANGVPTSINSVVGSTQSENDSLRQSLPPSANVPYPPTILPPSYLLDTSYSQIDSSEFLP